ncbi:hypothetical protein TDE_1834 [Treponema denticola ATCC 35405]|uniref:Uncharacterized protein n=1 Tax=Treponema denticola (strain ATCC 35405 / DSM 14222 / CIP 103919 / JCM 8153 / KCTC 15104) TaxID=243275 RepID=Q73LM8_TREDE|nr:hypothetical protein TDE_1778 [Treponema denticola ATCC 35405]AAS12349.1 hypothetical protein TDE_1834 [Treponema denticola ATCC 35405]
MDEEILENKLSIVFAKKTSSIINQLNLILLRLMEILIL